ncbi:MAG: hypothetical protein H8E55_11570 [Pelagibacterales bacterium]|nr:hypothetical protein [Pelagibacterales bacterium]
MKLVFLFLFLSLLSCSLNNTSDYWNKNLNLDKENLDYDKDYSIEEYEKILKEYNDRTGFPNIN